MRGTGGGVRQTGLSAYRRRPGDVLATVQIVLNDLGLTRVYLHACPLIGVLSVTFGLTAWCDGHAIRWRHAGEETTWSVSDAQGAAQRLAELARNAEVGL